MLSNIYVFQLTTEVFPVKPLRVKTNKRSHDPGATSVFVVIQLSNVDKSYFFTEDTVYIFRWRSIRVYPDNLKHFLNMSFKVYVESSAKQHLTHPVTQDELKMQIYVNKVLCKHSEVQSG